MKNALEAGNTSARSIQMNCRSCNMKGKLGPAHGGVQKRNHMNRNYVLCMLVSACASFAQSMFNPAMPVYGQTIGLSADIIGMITGVAMFICMFGRGITGKLSDTMSKKCLVWTGLAFTISGYILYFFARSMAVFFAARILQTVGSGIQITVLSALAISVVPLQTHTQRYCHFQHRLVAGPVFCAKHRDKSCLWGTFYHFIYSGACSDFAGSLSRVPY